MKRHLLFAALLLTGAAQAAPLHPVFQVDPYWPKPLPHGYVFGSSGGVTVDSHDNVWIYSRPTSTHITMSNPPEANNGSPAPSVVEISNDGRFIQGWGGTLAMSEEERSPFRLAGAGAWHRGRHSRQCLGLRQWPRRPHRTAMTTSA